MRLTKPAAVGFQIVGAITVLPALGALVNPDIGYVWPLIFLAVGIWMFIAGGRAARQNIREQQERELRPRR